MSLSLNVILLLITTISAQIAGVYFLPLTKGFTSPVHTIAGSLCFLVGIATMARLIHSGLNLSVIFPFVAAIVPLGAVVIGILVNGDPASLIRISVLVLACLAIGASSYL
ncbi:MAG: hypothetical protein A4E65_02483 [Syntrophorhabdus sp. PtaU1.Bin153]|nr:MAG: hypothetical protein A4E65_02483 [Syntrophorhabdus sp. PtaU1.Bin153]